MKKISRINIISFSLIVFFALSIFPYKLTGQEADKKKRKFPPAKHYNVSPATSKIKVDGVLDEDAWKNATVIKLPYEWYPLDNVPAPVDTDCLVTFSKSYLYVAFRCYDPDPKKIRAHLMDRDAIDTFVQDDHVVFQIDTFNDERRGFQFRVNPLGVQAEANFSELEGYEDFSWDAIWDSAGKITEFGYVVEVAIPFNQLRFPRTKEKQTWGFSASRSYPRKVRHRVISHVRDRNRNCIFCQFNKIKGFTGMSPGLNLEFDPTLTANRTDKWDAFPDGEMDNGKIKGEPGITARWGITPNLILNATANPDFSNVEADVAQLEVNTRFALRYPEKRPFFLEGADFFLTPFEAVFTRTVYDPRWGVKTTGKLGKNAVGFFATQDRYNNLIFPSNQGSMSTSIKDDVYSGVFRFRRDVGRGSTIGVLYTGRAGDNYSNHVYGLDGFIRLSRKNTVNFQYLHSNTEYPDELALDFGQKQGAFSGGALRAEYQYTSRNLYLQAGYRNLSDDFRADSGFIPRVGMRSYYALFHPMWYGKRGGWFSQLWSWVYAQRIEDQSGMLTDQSIELGAGYSGPLQSQAQFSYLFNKEYYGDMTYDIRRGQVLLSMKPRGGLSLSVFTQIGDSIDYYNYRLAYSFMVNPAVEFGIGKHLNINLNHIFERLSDEGNKIYDVNLAQARVVYNFNVRTFVRAIVQYTVINRDTDMYIFPIDRRTEGLFTQFLFSYKINPQTVLFLGYSDNYTGLPGIDITQTSRTFFLKIGYALVM